MVASCTIASCRNQDHSCELMYKGKGKKAEKCNITSRQTKQQEKQTKKQIKTKDELFG